MKFASLLSWLGPLVAFALILVYGLTPVSAMLAIMIWMLAWWLAGTIPLGLTALLPLILFPLWGISSLKETAASYSHPVIFLFLGGFILARAIEKHQLHRRMALLILRRSSGGLSSLLLGMMGAAALLSMWISNTATTVMMLPLGLSTLSILKENGLPERNLQSFSVALLLGLAYGANIGGIATLIGTPPNLVLQAMSLEAGLEGWSFGAWFFMAFPLAAVLFGASFLLLKRQWRGAPPLQLGAKLEQQWQAIGPLHGAELRSLWVLLITAAAWISRQWLNAIPGLESLSDTSIALCAAVLLFVLPQGRGSAKALLDSSDLPKLPWNIILLFGGAMALALGMHSSGAVDLIAYYLEAFLPKSLWASVLLITLFSIFLTEIMSNVAMVSIFIPVAMALAQKQGLDPQLLALPLSLGASCAFMLPIATPPNAIVFSAGILKSGHLLRSGFWLNLISTALISVYIIWWFS